FGREPLARNGFAPMAFAALGISEFDRHASDTVSFKVVPMQPAQAPVDVNMWQTNGPLFLALGGGARYQLMSRIAITGALRLNVVIGGNGLLMTYGPELGAAYGF